MSDDAVIDDETVRHVAELARIQIDENEVQGFVDDFQEIMEYFSALDELPEDVEKQDDLDTVWREDKVAKGLTQDEAIGNAEETEDGYIKGPSVSE